MIISATIHDPNSLTELALVSKAYWGYSNEQIQSWKEDLTVTSEMIEKMMVYKFVSDDTILGFYILNQPKKQNY